MGTKSTPTSEPYFLEPFIKDVPVESLFIPPTRIYNTYSYSGTAPSGTQIVSYVPQGRRIRIIDLYISGFTGVGANCEINYTKGIAPPQTVRKWGANVDIFNEQINEWVSETAVTDFAALTFFINSPGAITISLTYEII